MNESKRNKLSIDVSITDTEVFKDVLSIAWDIFNDERIDVTVRREIIERFNNILRENGMFDIDY